MPPLVLLVQGRLAQSGSSSLPPVSAPRVNMLTLQGLRYSEDNDCCRLADIGASVEVITC